MADSLESVSFVTLPPFFERKSSNRAFLSIFVIVRTLRKISGPLLTGIVIFMMAAGLLHRHGPALDVQDVICAECEAGVAGHSHISILLSDEEVCLVCQVLFSAFVAAAVLTLSSIWKVRLKDSFFLCESLPGGAIFAYPSRGPPSVS